MDLDGWHPDPFGTHQARLFKQGEPTALVKDDGIGSLDAPPATQLHAGRGASRTGRETSDGAFAGTMSVASALGPPASSCSDLVVDRRRDHRSAGSSASRRDLKPSVGALAEARQAVKNRIRTLQRITLILMAIGVLVAVSVGVGETTRSALTAAKLSPLVRSPQVLPPATTLTPLERALRALPRSTAPATSSSQSSNALSTSSALPVTQLPPRSTPPGSTEPVVPTTTSGATTATNAAPTPTTLAPPTTSSPAPTATPTPALVPDSTSSSPSPLPKERAAASPAVALGATAQVAVGLIRAVNQQSSGTEGIPVTADNVSLLDRWMANEGGLWADNPLNTSLDSAAYPHEFTASGQDTGDPIFPSLSAGIAATAATLLSNPSYTRILTVLKSGRTSCLSFATAVIQSPWASSHYGYDTARFCSGIIVPPVRLSHGHSHVVRQHHHVPKVPGVTRVNGPHGKGHRR